MGNIFIDYKSEACDLIDTERECSRIMTAAVVSERFRKLLLSNPRLAIKSGFGGEAFNLESEESERISSIKANSLAEFARQMNTYPHSSGVGFFSSD